MPPVITDFRPPRQSVRVLATTGVLVAAAVALTALVVVSTGRGAEAERLAAAERAAEVRRQAEVAAAGAQVMPFDLEATTHEFSPTGDGGVQTVTADDPTDVQQVQLVRSHLAEEAERFRQGDFADPAMIHGQDMPGLDALRAHGGELHVSYAEVAAGGRITFSSADPQLVSALHAWFEAQLRDHGRHARRS